MTPNLFCFLGSGKDPHGAKLSVSKRHRDLFSALPQESNDFVLVRDKITGKWFRVRREDCGFGCRCAARAHVVK